MSKNKMIIGAVIVIFAALYYFGKPAFTKKGLDHKDVSSISKVIYS